MELININPQDMIFSLDIGTRSIIGTIGIVKEKKFHVLAESYKEHPERAMVDGQIHDIPLVAQNVNEVKKDLEKKLNISLSQVAIAAAGRFLRTTTVKTELEIEEKEIDKEEIRGLELTAVKLAEEEIQEQTQGKLYCVGYSVKSYFLNGYVISNLASHKGEKIGVEIIATFLPRSVVDSLYAVMKKVGLKVTSLTLEPIAAMEAVIPQQLRLLNLALVDIGAGTSDIAISSKESISAYGMVPQAGDEITERIAQTYLVDFNTAEKMKKECTIKETVYYTDVLGLENEVPSEEVLKVIEPVVHKIGEEIASKIIELNGGKSPNAIFLVGGGAYTPYMKEVLAQHLNLPLQRIAVKGREAVTECSCEDQSLGSIGVTVLGIALTAIKRSGHDFIDVTLNDQVISLFNSHQHTVMEVFLQAGLNPKMLMAKNGKNIRFHVNNIKRIAFGTLAQNAVIKINGKISNMDAQVKEGDCIEICYAKAGKDAQVKVMEYVRQVNSVSFYMDDVIYHTEPIAFINGERASLQSNIQEEDVVEILYPTTLGEYIHYFDLGFENHTFWLEEKEIYKEYMLQEGDRIYTRCIKEESLLIQEDESEKKELPAKEAAVTVEEKELVKPKEPSEEKEITVRVNEQSTRLTGKTKYIFVDVFQYVTFDLSKPQGNLKLLLNGKNAGYYDPLQAGDEIKIYWEK